MLFRVVMVTTLLAAAVYVETISDTLPSRRPLYALITATYALSLLYTVALRVLPWRAPLIFAQVLGDLLIVTGLVYVLGDSRGGFLVLYPLSILAGAVLLARRENLLLSVLAVVMYAGLLLLVRQGGLPPRGLIDAVSAPQKRLAYSVFVTAVACGTVALVGSYLSQSLRTADERLVRAAEEVQDLQALNRLIVDSIQSGLLMVDSDGRIVHLNGLGASLLGVGAEAVRGQRVGDVLGAAELWPAALGARAAERAHSRFELRYRHPSGRLLDLGLSVSQLAPERRGRVRGYLLAFQDLTEVKAQEREGRARDRLAAVGEMAAYLAHEIRNPLASISGSAQMLLAERGMSAEHERLLSIIRRESQRLSDSLNQFLMHARPSARPAGPVDIAPVIAQAVALIENSPEVRQRHQVEFARDDGPVVCLADPDAITQVFWNLARNGIEAMPEGGTLRIDLRRDGRDAVLRVCDEGRGISEEERGRVFEPFLSRSPMGTGLGLAIVYRIVREHSGDIVLGNAPDGLGTEVEVRLPLVELRKGEATA